MTDLDALRKVALAATPGTHGVSTEFRRMVTPATVLALLDRIERQEAVVEAARALSDDEESQEGGWGPDITMLIPLRAALGRLDPDADYPSTHKMTLADEGEMEC